MVNRAIIFPIISGIVLILKDAFHLEFSADVANSITDVVLGLYTIYGVFMHPVKQKPPPSV